MALPLQKQSRVSITRRRHKRVIKVKIGKTAAQKVNVKVAVRNKKKKTLSSKTRTLRTNHTSYLTSPRVSSKVRSARVTFVSAVG